MSGWQTKLQAINPFGVVQTGGTPSTLFPVDTNISTTPTNPEGVGGNVIVGGGNTRTLPIAFPEGSPWSILGISPSTPATPGTGSVTGDTDAPYGSGPNASSASEYGNAADPNPTGLLSTFLASANGQEGLSDSLDPTDTNSQSGSDAQPLGIQASFADAPVTTTTTDGSSGSGVVIFLGVAIVLGALAYYYRDKLKSLIHV